jgi:hypothetical protein
LKDFLQFAESSRKIEMYLSGFECIFLDIISEIHNKELSLLDSDINDVDSYTEASVPTPPDQEDVSPIDMVGGAVSEVMDTLRDAIGMQDEPTDDDK